MTKLWHIAPVRLLGIVQALIALAIGFGLNLSPEQVALVLAAVASIAGIAGDQVAVSRTALDQLADAETTAGTGINGTT